MELVRVNHQPIMESIMATESSSDAFIVSNTKAVSLQHIKDECIIPAFAKDNESTISHTDFIQVTEEVARTYFSRERLLIPAVRVSHTVKGRIPEAKGKPASLLLPEEETQFYERMAFAIEIPSISETVNGNKLSLTIGGVRALNHENLYGKKTDERFKVFVGFKNHVCTNLCISTDGLKDDIKVRTVGELYGRIFEMLEKFNAVRQLNSMKELSGYCLSESKFAQFIGRAKLYQFLPPALKANVPIFPLSDTQTTIIAKEYYSDENFQCEQNGSIDLWRVYNLFTGANKSSYIDNFLKKAVDSSEFVNSMKNCMEGNSQSWFLS
jgi:hypothetical protein